jgi:hypothetical protein
MSWLIAPSKRRQTPGSVGYSLPYLWLAAFKIETSLQGGLKEYEDLETMKMDIRSGNGSPVWIPGVVRNWAADRAEDWYRNSQ